MKKRREISNKRSYKVPKNRISPGPRQPRRSIGSVCPTASSGENRREPRGNKIQHGSLGLWSLDGLLLSKVFSMKIQL